MIGIYKITSPSGKVYIGQSVNIDRRIKEYKLLKCKKQTKLYNSFLKYGFENHNIEVVCICSIDDLNEKERFFQDKYNCLKRGLNCYLTTTKDKSGVLSEETKLKISKGVRNPSLETREKMSKSQTGKTVPIEMRIKISNTSKKRIFTEEQIKNLIKAGSNPSKETRLKKSIAATGKKQSEETKRKISEAGLGRKHSEESKLKIASKHGKRVIDTQTGEVFLSVAKAAKYLGCNISNLHGKLKGTKRNNTNLKFA